MNLTNKEIERILLALDPVELYDPDADNLDEYTHEALFILQRLPECKTVEDLFSEIASIFVNSFGVSYKFDGETPKRVEKTAEEEIIETENLCGGKDKFEMKCWRLANIIWSAK